MPKKPLLDMLLAQVKDARASLRSVERTARRLQTARALADARAARALAWRVEAVEGMVPTEPWTTADGRFPCSPAIDAEIVRLTLGMQRATFRRVLEVVERRGVVRVKGDRLVRIAKENAT